ncbi:MAG: hypothetical protein IJZ39_01215, partial [Oscillospiraceae bacterium]|nr:hypothetical protein [Oscillospiraceae bacterium]
WAISMISPGSTTMNPCGDFAIASPPVFDSRIPLYYIWLGKGQIVPMFAKIFQFFSEAQCMQSL